MPSSKRGMPKFAFDSVSQALITRLFYDAVEASEADMLSPDGGLASEVSALDYSSPGIPGQRWKSVGLDPAFAILEGSLNSSSGPWTNLTTSSLADPSAEGTANVLWIRLLTKRWAPDDSNPSFDFQLRLSVLGNAAVEEP